MPTPIPAEDEALFDTYQAAFDAALPAATPMDRDKARRVEVACHAAGTIAVLKALIAASQLAA